MKTRILLSLALAIFIAVGIGYTQRASIADRLMAVALPARMGMNQVTTLEDGLHVALCGAGGPMPAPKASGPCVRWWRVSSFFLWTAAPTAHATFKC